MAKIIHKDNQENVYIFLTLIVLSIITFRQITIIERKRKEITAALMEPYDPNIL
ncbi:hypothetical protein [Planococcus maritimus]|uniref:hypothetical protein n=1 Tax=Planococcus maritimus TaxID=192421 RepID=UPI00232FE60A|nr:hypothetical protein [Planococcus maritimus]